MTRSRCVVGVLMLGCVVGCGQSYRVKTVPASGTVTYQGQPVAKAILFIVPENPKSTTEAPNANATTDAQGRFIVSTYATGDGAVPGNYLVGISKSIPDPATANDPVPGTLNALPERYQNPTTSGLKMTVDAGKKNDVKFELTD